MNVPRDLTAEGVAIVDSGTPEQAMRFLTGLHCEDPGEIDPIAVTHIWEQIPATLCAELVAMALKRTPARHNDDRTLVEIIYARGKEDPDATDWESLRVPEAHAHLVVIKRQQEIRHADKEERLRSVPPPGEEYINPAIVVSESSNPDGLDEIDPDSNVIPFPLGAKPRLTVASRLA